jgi:Protein of unknown function (DUF3237)
LITPTVVRTRWKGKYTVLELIPLANATYRTREFIEVGVGPAGRRIVGEIASVRFEGARLRGDLYGAAAADWVLVGPRSVIAVDVRYTLRTDDGALVYVQYDGRSDGSDGQGRKPTYSAARFETADPRYAWLNTILAVGKAEFRGEELHYEWFELS